MAKRKKSSLTTRIKKKFRLYRSKIILCVIALCVAYIGYLYSQIISRFENHRWNLPSRIYSDSFPLFEGKAITPNEVNERLENLNYRKIEDTPQSPGEYVIKGNTYTVYLHSFDYPHEKFVGALVTFDITNNHIHNLNKMKSASVALEPEMIASIFDENLEDRTFVSFDKIPKNLVNAVIAIEDERFYHHHGVDPYSILRAIFADLRALKAVQGGSTLTQQLVKNFFLHHHKTIGRKISEACMALIMELKYSKNEILESYLNEIYLGKRGIASIAGVGEAAHYYFSKDVDQLNLAEAALLAGLIRSPGGYSPFQDPAKSIKRRNVVLQKMLEQNLITQKDHDAALGSPLPFSKTKYVSNALYFVELVKNQLKESFSEDILISQGLRVFTTLDMNWQRAAEKSVTDGLEKLETDFASLKKNHAKGLHLQAALVAIQPSTGFVKAYVGGRNYSKTQFDHLLQAKRQPGSTFKPFVYLTALSANDDKRTFTLASLLKDEPLSLSNAGKPWQPDNYDKTFHGPVRLRTALENSYNAATVWLGHQIGFDRVVDTARAAGINSDLQPYPSLALGAFEVTPLEMARAYTVFPNAGTKTNLLALRRVVTPDGKVLEKKNMELQPVFDPQTIYLLNHLLKGVIDHGTAVSARTNGFHKIAAGKTGTTSNTRDAWFVGYTPNLVTLTWVGYDDNSVTGLTGASGALPMWTTFMKKATVGQNDDDFPIPTNIVTVPIDDKTGLLYEKSCSQKVIEYFVAGTEPTKSCK